MERMTPEEWMAAATAAKLEYENETRELVEQIERTRAKAVRLEARLAAIHEQYRNKVAHMGASFLGLPAAELPPAPASPLAARKEAVGERKRRGVLDEPVLALARELASPDVTSRQIEEVWNQRTPERPIQDSTVRSILDRLSRKGLIVVSQEGAGKGKGIPRRYRPAS